MRVNVIGYKPKVGHIVNQSQNPLGNGGKEWIMNSFRVSHVTHYSLYIIHSLRPHHTHNTQQHDKFAEVAEIAKTTSGIGQNKPIDKPHDRDK